MTHHLRESTSMVRKLIYQEFHLNLFTLNIINENECYKQMKFIYLLGLFLEGASLDRKTGKLVESRPKVLYEQMPVIYIYAINTTAGKDSKLYECPIYRKPARTDLNYIGSIDFESDIGPRHWTMRGVALLCDIK